MSAADRLGRSRSKRDRRKTPAPDAPRFVIERHDATTRHDDLRLEVEGVLRSWTVPEDPSTEPASVLSGCTLGEVAAGDGEA